MKYIQLEELKSIQMDVLNTIHMFCENKNITYSLGCGTMLGAIRHKGYIPWDDDIDIFMFRNDYDRFISEYPYIINNVKVVSLERDSTWPRAYAQAYNDRTILKDGPSKYHVGVGIDIFPIDYVPENDIKWILFNNIRKLLQCLYDMKYIEFRKERGLVKNMLLAFSKAVLMPISLRKIAEVIDIHAKKYQNIKSKFVFDNSQGSGLMNRFNSNLFEDIIDLPFENYIFKGFANFDNYLKNTYGNYMELPPEEKRISHHDFVAYWKN